MVTVTEHGRHSPLLYSTLQADMDKQILRQYAQISAGMRKVEDSLDGISQMLHSLHNSLPQGPNTILFNSLGFKKFNLIFLNFNIS